ncbi:hypothetical protein ACLESD_11235 [Pyxidicoccus sp. 3LFB2]
MPTPSNLEAAQRPLTGQDIRTLGLAALGGALEFYDFIIFVFFTTVIGQLFFPPDTPDWLRQLQAFGLFAAGYLARRWAASSWRTSATAPAASACSRSASS